ncbi:hypothetical protein SAMD00019534_017870 [Acytostelium subglobosum LB1]|uniref:hypothetical protein n=1 Tax=Acytostelium subglobosum LB1 TaxID=1410327 RepID=UPI000644D635|nr:hypothetical protein SAMD00019534_017870 [Acytostelium subglobosum LB1]GAM18612.1 hypothetical protein SAMD00019534_017870 [Acytostelium subglobosum LB1]|eukprot:XP_012757832.1 hypothetical protein SAMD00019534_017870 [Acytostelium subglobosum LB1]
MVKSPSAPAVVLQCDSIVELLKTLTIESVNSTSQMNRGVITVRRSDSLDLALKVLTENDISSCPVIDPKLGCMGLVDMFDIVAYLLAMFSKQQLEFTNSKQQNSGSAKMLGMNFFKLNLDPVSVVINKSDDVETLCPVVTEIDSVHNLIQLFAIGCHRVPVYSRPQSLKDSADRIPRLNRIISQTDVVLWLWNNQAFRSEIMKSGKKVEDYYHANPKSVNQNTPTFEVLKLLHNNKISAVAVVDDRGNLKNEICTDSWKGTNEKNIDNIFEDVKTFLRYKQKKDLKKHELAKCTLDTPIYDVWEMVATNRHHRVWVVDRKKLIGIISLVDLLRPCLSMSIGGDGQM